MLNFLYESHSLCVASGRCLFQPRNAIARPVPISHGMNAIGISEPALNQPILKTTKHLPVPQLSFNITVLRGLKDSALIVDFSFTYFLRCHLSFPFICC